VVKVIKKDESKQEILNGTKAYIQLRQQVTEHGVLNRAYGYYTVLSLVDFFGLFFSVYQIIVTPLSFLLVFWCLVAVFFIVQFGGLFHDAGHRAIAKSTKVNDVLGFIYSTTIAMGYSYWRINHNKHHSHTNQEDEDPDLDLPLHAFTQRQFAKQKGVYKLLRKYQAYIYYPLRSLVGFTQRTDSLRYFKQERTPGAILELIVWLAAMFVWFALPFFIFPLAKAFLVFFVVHIGTGFYISNIFAPNHKGMPQLAKNVKISFLEHQIMTSRNIYGHWLTDFVFMGLNYQIEHHLFPNCPRNKLKEITPHVLEICRKMNLEYTQVTVIESNRIILATLSQVAAPKRPVKKLRA
jgi:fatty acid desaturase